MSDTRNDDEVRALLEERHGYEVRALAARAAQVDEQLKARGYAVPVERHAPDGETAAPSARKRTRRP